MTLAVELVELTEPIATLPPLSVVCDGRELRAASRAAARAIAPKAPTADLACIRLDATADRLDVRSTDLSTDVYVRVSAIVAAPGAVLVPARMLVAALARSVGQVTLVISGDSLHVRSNAGYFTLPARDPASFPALTAAPRRVDAALEREEARRLLARTSHAMSADPARAHLYGTWLEREGEVLRMVACDGHRLAVAGTPSQGPDFGMIVPRRGIEALARLVERPGGVVRIHWTDDRIEFEDDTTRVRTVLVDAIYPAWRHVVPGSSRATVKLDPGEALGALHAIASRTTLGTVLTFAQANGVATCTTEDGDHRAAVEVRAVIAGEPPPRIGVNARYLRDALAAAPTEGPVTIELNGPLDPIKLVAADGSTWVIMPMRV